MEKIKILGRRSFYQWDLDQKLLVEDDRVEQLHFVTSGEAALVCPVYMTEGVRMADVPNILLQSAEDIKAFAVGGGKTLYARIFTVNDRMKPDDYIYTETEAWTVEGAVTKALQAAKENGDFKGDPGPKGDPGAVKYVVVTELPETDTENAIYLLPTTEGAEDNLFDEYIWANGKWEKIGSAAVAVDMTGYVKNTDYAQDKAGVVAVNPTAFGIGAYPHNGVLYITPADKAQVDAKEHTRRPITPHILDYAVKKGLADSKEEWTEDEKKATRDLVGAVGNTDLATPSKAGVVRVNPSFGVLMVGENLTTVCAENAQIDAKSDGYRPITPKYLDYAVKVALTTNSIALTDEEKAAVRAWLGIE